MFMIGDDLLAEHNAKLSAELSAENADNKKFVPRTKI